MLPLLLVNVDHKIHPVLPYSNLNEDVSLNRTGFVGDFLFKLGHLT